MTSTLAAPHATATSTPSVWTGGYVTLQGDVVRPPVAGSYVRVDGGQATGQQVAAASALSVSPDASIPGGSYVTLPASVVASASASVERSLAIAQRAGVGAGNYISLA